MSSTGFSIDNILKLINKHGAIGVLAIWLFLNNSRLNKLEDLLHDCYKQQYTYLSVPFEKNFLVKKWEAVIPDKIKIASNDDNNKRLI